MKFEKVASFPGPTPYRLGGGAWERGYKKDRVGVKLDWLGGADLAEPRLLGLRPR